MKFELRTNESRKPMINWASLSAYFARWQPGTVFDIEIVRRQSKESDPMRKYYFSTVLPITEETLGYDPDDDLHKLLKIKYFRVQPDKHGIYRHKDIPSVFSKDSPFVIEEKWKFVQWVMRKCAEQGGYVPEPGEPCQ